MALTQGRKEGLDRATTVYIRVEYGEDGWAPSGGVAQLSWWFSVGLVSASASSGI